MKASWRVFGLFVRLIARDRMLWAACLVPLLTAFMFRFGVPYADVLLCDYLQRQKVLTDYYLLIDLWLCLTPSYMLGFASAMVMLSERDENIGRHLAVTPVGKSGYLLSRLVFPAVVSFFYSLLLTRFFSLADWGFPELTAVSLSMSISSAAAMCWIVAYSRNRVEGMAMAKMASLIYLGPVAPFFPDSVFRYPAVLLPTYWIAGYVREGHGLLMFPALAVALAWIVLTWRRIVGKLY